MKKSILALATLALVPAAASAEVQLSVFAGIQEAPHSTVTGTDPDNTSLGGVLDFTAGWEGKSFAPPPYYGFRATWWRSENLGFGVEYTHDKVYADAETLAEAHYDRFEFTDGLNILTANVNYRWPAKWMDGKATPYVGGGLGFAFPHVDITASDGGPHTFGYQITGAAVRLYAGSTYQINDNWALLGEYQFTYSQHDVDLDNGGGFETNVITNAINLGVSYTF